MKELPVRVVSLKRAAKRRKQFASQPGLQRLPFEFFDAFDARAATPEEIASWQDADACLRNKGRLLAPSEVACARSHRALYAQCLERGYDGMLIVEDDAEILPGFDSVLAHLAADQASRASERCVIFLGRPEHFMRDRLVLGERTGRPAGNDHKLKRVVVSLLALDGTYGYYITAAACAAILQAESRVCNVADAWDAWLKSGVLDLVWFVDPPVVRHPQSQEESEIERDRHRLDLQHEAGNWGGVVRLKLLRLSIRVRARVGRWVVFPFLRKFG